MIKNHGLIIPEIRTREEGAAHILGGTARRIINSDANWIPYLPKGEKQRRNGVETNSCTLQGTNNAIETQIKQKTGIEVNYSDRYVANRAYKLGILNPNVGADPHKIAEMFRVTSGVVAEEDAPWTEDIKSSSDFYNLELAELMKEGPKWYKDWKLYHEWVWTGSPSPEEKRGRLRESAQKGTVCLSVRAWEFENGLYVKSPGTSDTHWTQAANIPEDKSKPYNIFDSYDESEGDFIKDLHPLYDFGVAKVYYVVPNHIFLKNLFFGVIDPEVVHLQRALTTLGYSIPHAVTSVYGTETRSAVMAFQRDNNIEDDGSHFGPKTRYALNKAQFSNGIVDDLLLLFRSYTGL